MSCGRLLQIGDSLLNSVYRLRGWGNGKNSMRIKERIVSKRNILLGKHRVEGHSGGGHGVKWAKHT